MSDSYYIQRGQKTSGPFTIAKIQEAIRTNKITSEDRASTNRDGPWASLGLLHPDWFKSDASPDSSMDMHGTVAWQMEAEVASQQEHAINTAHKNPAISNITLQRNADQNHENDFSNLLALVARIMCILAPIVFFVHLIYLAERIDSTIYDVRNRLEETNSKLQDLSKFDNFVHERVSWQGIAKRLDERNNNELRLISCQRVGDSLTGRAVYDLIWAGDYSKISKIRDSQKELEKQAEKLLEEALGR